MLPLVVDAGHPRWFSTTARIHPAPRQSRKISDFASWRTKCNSHGEFIGTKRRSDNEKVSYSRNSSGGVGRGRRECGTTVRSLRSAASAPARSRRCAPQPRARLGTGLLPLGRQSLCVEPRILVASASSPGRVGSRLLDAAPRWICVGRRLLALAWLLTDARRRNRTPRRARRSQRSLYPFNPLLTRRRYTARDAQSRPAPLADEGPCLLDVPSH
jgi:hypothetical protein